MIAVENLSIELGSFRLREISFSIEPGQYGLLMGKTGSGKTTLLEAVAGLKPVRQGRILLHGQDVTHWKPADRNIGYVPQDGALFTTMQVRDQLGFALTIRHVPRPKIDRRVDYLARMLDIGHLLDRTPHGLSGGEKQRVALGRALAFGPQVLCLDEPLSALDDQTRDQIIDLLRRISRETGVTCLHVTHNLEEARALADVQLLLQDGQVTVSSCLESNHAPAKGANSVPSSPQPRGPSGAVVRQS